MATFNSKSADTWNKTFGMPPSVLIDYDDTLITNKEMDRLSKAMLVISLQPGWPKLSSLGEENKSLNIFEFDPDKGSDKYSQILNNVKDTIGNNIQKRGFQAVVMNDGAIQETWTSQYTDSMAEGMASSMQNELGTMGRAASGMNANELASKVSGIAGGMFGEAAGISGGEGKGQQSLSNMGKVLDSNMLGAMQGMGMNVNPHLATNSASAALNLMTGSKIDFPKIWRGSNYSPSYTFTTRLYNPYPNDKNAYRDFILNPLAHFVAFMTPPAEDFTFGFPVLCRVECPGLLQIKAGYMSNLSVIKGGDQNDFAFNQQPNMIELRYTIEELYDTMIAKISNKVLEDRPTLSSYLQILSDKMEIPDDLNLQGIVNTATNTVKSVFKTTKNQSNVIPKTPTQLNNTRLDDPLALSRTPMGLNEADNALNLTQDQLSSPNYINYLTEKNQLNDVYLNNDINGISQGDDLALMMKYGLVSDQNLTDYFNFNYDSLNSTIIIDGQSVNRLDYIFGSSSTSNTNYNSSTIQW